MRVTVIDYKAGNLTSVLKALRHLGAEAEVTDGDLAPVEAAERMVLRRGPLRGTQRLDATGSRPQFVQPSRAAFPFSASALACSGSTRAQAKRVAAWTRALPEHCTRFSESAKKSRT